MDAKSPYLDPNISISRIARQLQLPTRAISSAVNRTQSRNFSQFINQYRVQTACELLTTTDHPVTEIMFNAGFQTKSTFNREFLAVTGQSPSSYRRTGPH